jgi:hypothetical protein
MRAGGIPSLNQTAPTHSNHIAESQRCRGVGNYVAFAMTEFRTFAFYQTVRVVRDISYRGS